MIFSLRLLHQPLTRDSIGWQSVFSELSMTQRKLDYSIVGLEEWIGPTRIDTVSTEDLMSRNTDTDRE